MADAPIDHPDREPTIDRLPGVEQKPGEAEERNHLKVVARQHLEDMDRALLRDFISRPELVEVEPELSRATLREYEPKDVQKMERLYTSNLVDPHVFLSFVLSHDPSLPALVRDAHRQDFMNNIAQGGMLNEWEPSEDLKKYYKKYSPNYRPVGEETLLDMMGMIEGRPWPLEVCALEDQNGNPIATLTTRAPDPADLENYSKYVAATLYPRSENIFRDMAYAEKWGRTAMEVHTINVVDENVLRKERKWRYAGTALLLAKLKQMKAQRGVSISNLYYYRFDSLLSLEPFQGDPAESPTSINLGSRDFFTKLGCRELGFYEDPKDVVVRDFPISDKERGIMVARPKWRYGIGRIDDVIKNAEEKLAREGVSIETLNGGEIVINFPRPAKKNGRSTVVGS